jgi:hypothetical protein
MSEFRVDTITDRAGTGSPNFPNGLTLNGLVPVSNTPAWSETGTAPSALATENRIINYNRGGKNIIVNGNMNVHQRSSTTVTSISTSGYYTSDRWYTDASTASTSAVFSQLVDATDFPVNSEFRKCLKTTCTTAKASLAVGDYVKVVQKIEGQNVQVLKKGTTAAETMTLSFWVESGVTGTYICELVDLQNSRQISKAYTISSSGVWEQKTINFPSDTAGTLSNDTSARFEVSFWLAAGLTFTGGTLNNSSWASFTNANRAAGQVNLASATNNFWNLTGVQLEIGSIANPFEYKSYSEHLNLCQRYYSKLSSLSGNYVAFGSGFINSSTLAVVYLKYPLRMRATPVLSQSNTAIFEAGGVFAVTSLGNTWYGDESLYVNINVASGLTTGRGCILVGNNNSSAFIELNAELT